ncbi:hypothetical protein SJAG_03259 [Schizosaccharomyces japonicus yFS275]|uniref:Uncharacterized protein n=1 Tax=Schizosaccharomyces japonicus (strain yFS275 / FY16936) TaxID=402676 RepID=B6K3R8_SCHJY|nr:hypothetical protein SJAG_03259 [Schizosaccharomyces japonicus yFS275]EEB08125.1 hypothetical protein SJAG_03259 [Schizosaccharomyces japonicus yFS275]
MERSSVFNKLQNGHRPRLNASVPSLLGSSYALRSPSRRLEHSMSAMVPGSMANVDDEAQYQMSLLHDRESGCVDAIQALLNRHADLLLSNVDDADVGSVRSQLNSQLEQWCEVCDALAQVYRNRAARLEGVIARRSETDAQLLQMERELQQEREHGNKAALLDDIADLDQQIAELRSRIDFLEQCRRKKMEELEIANKGHESHISQLKQAMFGLHEKIASAPSVPLLSQQLEEARAQAVTLANQSTKARPGIAFFHDLCSRLQKYESSFATLLAEKRDTNKSFTSPLQDRDIRALLKRMVDMLNDGLEIANTNNWKPYSVAIQHEILALETLITQYPEESKKA